MLMIIEMVEIEGMVVVVVVAAVTTQLETSFPSPVVSQHTAPAQPS